VTIIPRVRPRSRLFGVHESRAWRKNSCVARSRGAFGAPGSACHPNAGIVDVRHGQGVYVREAPRPEGLSFATWQSSHPYAIGELLAFRLLVEPELAALAAVHADEEFVNHLDRILRNMGVEAERSNLHELVQLDTAFHDAITTRAGNRLYLDLLNQVAQALVDSRRISLSVPGRALQVTQAHRAIVEAIRAGDADGAWTAMQRHLDRFSSDMQVQPVGWREGAVRRDARISVVTDPQPDSL
jgi:DNA-binding FadR family transcriptional regulator